MTEKGQPPAGGTLSRFGGRKFIFLIILTGVLLALLALVILRPPEEARVYDLAAKFLEVFMWIALAVVSGNVVAKFKSQAGKLPAPPDE